MAFSIKDIDAWLAKNETAAPMPEPVLEPRIDKLSMLPTSPIQGTPEMFREGQRVPTIKEQAIRQQEMAPLHEEAMVADWLAKNETARPDVDGWLQANEDPGSWEFWRDIGGIPKETVKGIARGAQGVVASGGDVGAWLVESNPYVGRILSHQGVEEAAAKSRQFAHWMRQNAQEGWEASDLTWRKRPLSKAFASAGEAAPLYATAIAATAATKSPVVGALIFGITGGSSTYEDARQHGLGPGVANLYAIIDGAWQGISEQIPVNRLFGREGVKLLERMAKGAIEEGVQEIVQNGVSNLIAKGYDPERAIMTMDEFLQSVTAGAILGAGGGAFTGAGPTETQMRALRDRRSLAQAMEVGTEGGMFVDPDTMADLRKQNKLILDGKPADAQVVEAPAETGTTEVVPETEGIRLYNTPTSDTAQVEEGVTAENLRVLGEARDGRVPVRTPKGDEFFVNEADLPAPKPEAKPAGEGVETTKQQRSKADRVDEAYQRLEQEGYVFKGTEDNRAITLGRTTFPIAEKDGVRINIDSQDRFVVEEEVMLGDSTIGNSVTIGIVAVDSSARGQGKFKQAMGDVLRITDEQGLDVLVEPRAADVGGKGLTTAQLVEQYKKMGFVQKEKGSNQLLIRKASAPTEAKQSPAEQSQPMTKEQEAKLKAKQEADGAQAQTDLGLPPVEGVRIVGQKEGNVTFELTEEGKTTSFVIPSEVLQGRDKRVKRKLIEAKRDAKLKEFRKAEADRKAAEEAEVKAEAEAEAKALRKLDIDERMGTSLGHKLGKRTITPDDLAQSSAVQSGAVTVDEAGEWLESRGYKKGRKNWTLQGDAYRQTQASGDLASDPVRAYVLDAGLRHEKASSVTGKRAMVEETNSLLPYFPKKGSGNKGRTLDQLLRDMKEDPETEGLVADWTEQDLLLHLKGQRGRQVSEGEHLENLTAAEDARINKEKTELIDPLKLKPGDTFRMDGETYTVTEEGDTALMIRSDSGKEMGISFESELADRAMRIEQGSIQEGAADSATEADGDMPFDIKKGEGKDAKEKADDKDSSQPIQAKEEVQEGQEPDQDIDKGPDEETRKKIRTHVDSLNKKFTRGQARLIKPENLPEKAKQQARDLGYDPSDFVGYYDQTTGIAYLNEDKMHSISDVEKIYAHEVVAHKGLRLLLGKDFDRILEDIYEKKSEYWEVLSAIAKDRKFDLSTQKGKALAVDELLARIAGRVEGRPAVRHKLLTRVRNILRKMGFRSVMGWRLDDIADLIIQARNSLVDDGDPTVRLNITRQLMPSPFSLGIDQVLDDAIDRIATTFSGGGTLEAALPRKHMTVFASEYDQERAEAYYEAHGYMPDTRDITKMPTKEAIKHVKKADAFGASPVCVRFSSMARAHGNKPQQIDTDSAKKVAAIIRGAKPKVLWIENAPEYKDAHELTYITKVLDELGYVWKPDVFQAKDYGAATSRERMILRAVQKGMKLPPLPEKTGGSDWYPLIKDLLTKDVIYDRGLAPREQELLDDFIKRGVFSGKKPVFLTGIGKSSLTEAGGPANALLAGNALPKIWMPDGTVYRGTARMLARIMGLPDSYVLPRDEYLARSIIGNGVNGEITRKIIAPLIDVSKGRDVGQFSLEGDRLPYKIFDVKVGWPTEGTVEVVQNPSERDYTRFAKRFRRDFPSAPPGTPRVRATHDGRGNTWIWYADEAMHFQVEDRIKAITGRDVSQTKTEGEFSLEGDETPFQSTRESIRAQKRATPRQLEIIKAIKADRRAQQSSFAGFKRWVMEREGIPSDAFHDWDVPLDYQYALARTREGGTHAEAVRMVGAKGAPEPADRRKGQFSLETDTDKIRDMVDALKVGDTFETKVTRRAIHYHPDRAAADQESTKVLTVRSIDFGVITAEDKRGKTFRIKLGAYPMLRTDKARWTIDGMAVSEGAFSLEQDAPPIGPGATPELTGENKRILKLLRDDRVSDAVKAGLNPQRPIVSHEEQVDEADAVMKTFNGDLDRARWGVLQGVDGNGNRIKERTRGLLADWIAEGMDLEHQVMVAEGNETAANEYLVLAQQFYEQVQAQIASEAGRILESTKMWHGASPAAQRMWAKKQIQKAQVQEGAPGIEETQNAVKETQKVMDEAQKNLTTGHVTSGAAEKLSAKTQDKLAETADQIAESQVSNDEMVELFESLMRAEGAQDLYRKRQEQDGMARLKAQLANKKHKTGPAAFAIDEDAVANSMLYNGMDLSEIGFAVMQMGTLKFDSWLTEMLKHSENADLPVSQWKSIYAVSQAKWKTDAREKVAESIAEASTLPTKGGKKRKPKSRKQARKQVDDAVKAERQRKREEAKKRKEIKDKMTLWERYVDEASKKLLKRDKRPSAILEKFTNRLTAQLKRKMDPETREKVKDQQFKVLEEALANKEKYQDVVEAWYQKAMEQAGDDAELQADIIEMYTALSTDPLPTSQTNFKRAVAQVLNAFEVDMDKIIRQPQATQIDFVKNITDNMMLALGLDISDAESIARAITAEIKDRMAASVASARKRIVDGVKREDVKKALVAEWDKIVELVHMGLFTDAEVYNAIADKMGLPAFTPEFSAQISDLARRQAQAPDGIPSKLLQEEAQRLMRRQIGVKLSDLLFDTYYASLLSGWGTHMVNVGNNALTLGFWTMIGFMADPKNIQQNLKDLPGAMRRGFWKGLHDMNVGVRTGFWRGRWTDTHKLETRGSLEDITYGEAGGVPVQGLVGKKLKRILESFFFSAHNGWKYVFRMLQGEDSVAYNVALEVRAQQIANKMTKDPAKKAEILNTGKAALEAAREQAENEGFEIDPNAGKWKRSLQYSQREQRALEIIEMARHKDAKQSSEQYASFVTFNAPTRSTLLGNIARGINRVAESKKGKFPILLPGGRIIEIPVGKLVKLKIVPFTSIIANVGDMFLDLTPWGAVRAYRAEANARRGDTKEKEEVPLEMRERIIGSMFLTTLFIALKWMGADDEDSPVEWIGRGPGWDRDGIDAWSKSGRKPFSVYIKGKGSIPLAETPLAPLVAFLGGWSDYERYEPKGITPEEKADRLKYAALQVWGLYNSQGPMQGLSEAGNVLFALGSGDFGRAKREANKLASSGVGSLTVPRLASQIHKIFDPTVYDYEGIKQQLIREIPVVNARHALPAIGYDGEKRVYNGENTFERALYRFYHPEKTQPELEYAAKHNQWKIFNSPQRPDWMTYEQWREYEQNWRQPFTKKMRALVRTNPETNIDPILKEWQDYYRKRARSEIKKGLTEKEFKELDAVEAIAYVKGLSAEEKTSRIRGMLRDKWKDHARSIDVLIKKEKDPNKKAFYQERRSLMWQDYKSAK